MDSNEITIEQIAATLAHEIKNPISLVMACIDLMEYEDLEGRNKRSYGIMRRELGKVMDITLDFIHLTKPMEVPNNTIYVDKLLSKIIADCKEFYKDKADFEWSTDEPSLQITGDEIKLRQVFFNIYKNSVEALDGYGFIKTSISRCNEFVKICIEDNGIGLTGEVKKKITSPFFTTKENGSGLGVFICRNIIAEHKGYFEIDGEYASGCTVTVKLPLKE